MLATQLRRLHALLLAAAPALCRASEPWSLLINHQLAKTPPVQVNLNILFVLMIASGNTNASSIDFFDNVFTFFNESVIVNCCRPDNTVELATCGLGASCAGSCSALGASLCPSGNCSGDCEISFEQETNQIESRRWSAATLPSSAFQWCSRRCNVWRHKGCCYHPACRQRRSRACRWMNYLTGVTISSTALYCCELTFTFRQDMSVSWQPAPWQLDLRDAGDSNPRNLFPG